MIEQIEMKITNKMQPAIAEATFHRRVASREKIGAARHEVVHASIVRRLGGWADPQIWSNTSGSPYEKAWLGTCKIFADPGTVTFDKASRDLFKIIRTPKNWPVLVGTAGIVAEEVGKGVHDPNEIQYTLEDAIEEGKVTNSSNSGIGETDGSSANRLLDRRGGAPTIVLIKPSPAPSEIVVAASHRDSLVSGTCHFPMPEGRPYQARSNAELVANLKRLNAEGFEGSQLLGYAAVRDRLCVVHIEMNFRQQHAPLFRPTPCLGRDFEQEDNSNVCCPSANDLAASFFSPRSGTCRCARHRSYPRKPAEIESKE